jgi:hypothetical protein
MTKKRLKMELQPTAKRRVAFWIKNETLDSISYFKICYAVHCVRQTHFQYQLNKQYLLCTYIWCECATPSSAHAPSSGRNMPVAWKPTTIITFMWPSIVTNSLIIKTTRCTNFSNLFCFENELYMFRTVPMPIIRSYSLCTQQWYMWYRFVDSFRAAAGPGWSCCCSKAVYSVQWITPDDGQRNCPKHVEFVSKTK